MDHRLFFPFLALPVSVYGSRLEVALIALVAKHFDISRKRVENPNEPEHEEGYRHWAHSADAGLMNYFHEVVFPECDGVVALPFLDGRMGIDVADSAQWFIREGLPTFVINTAGEVTPVSLQRFETNPRCTLFYLRQMTEEERSLVMANDPLMVIPHKECPEYYPLLDKQPIQ
ncbi:MAG: hypothetical protein NUV60_03530 [Patescibacteria group bacterium]|nr:hypothetical protein [Patescibacteria group bacterium]